MKILLRLLPTWLTLALLVGCVAPSAVPATAETQTSVDTPNAETRLVQHGMGESAVPTDPQRVVVLDTGELDAALALGIMPVGSVTRFDDGLFPDYLAAETEGIEVVGTIGAPNLEKIVTLTPDLILSNRSRDEAIYPLLSEIAPTVLAAQLGPVWKENFQLYADALNKQAEAEAVVASYEGRLADLRTALGEEGANLTVSMVRFVDGGTVRVYHPGSFIGIILDDAGLQRPAGQQNTDEVWTAISQELIPELDADAIFYGVYGDPANTPLDAFLNDPLWAGLSAVQAGRVYPVPDEYWYAGLGYLAADRVIDDLWRNLIGEEPVASDSITVLAETSEYRLIRDAASETQVPLNPQCIVVAGSGYLDHLLTLGVKPCGAAHGPGGSGFPEFLADQLTDVEYVGGVLEVSLERVALTNPDLIIGMYPEHISGQFAANFAPIAPTVYLTEPWRDWRHALTEIGLILGKQDIATAKLAEFDARLTEAQRQLVAAIGDEKVMFLRVLPSEIRPYGTASPTGDILFNRLGLTPAAGVPMGEHAQSISLETIPEIDADHLFLLDQTEDQMVAIMTNPLWQTIPAVQKGNIYPVDVKIWIQGEGMLAYTKLVEDVLAALVGGSQ